MGADTCRSIIKFRHFNRHSEDRTSQVNVPVMFGYTLMQGIRSIEEG